MGITGNYSRAFSCKAGLIFGLFGTFVMPLHSALAAESTYGYADTTMETRSFHLNTIPVQSSAAPSAIPSLAFGPPDTMSKKTGELPKASGGTLVAEPDEQEIRRKKLKTIYRLEVAYQLLGALDAAQTISCVKKPTCQEATPLLGKRPSVAGVVGFKLAAGLLHYIGMRHEVKRDRLGSALTFEIVTISVQGVVCGLNFRNAF